MTTLSLMTAVPLHIVLDANILGNVVNPEAKSQTVQAVKQWALQMQRTGHIFVIPAVAFYEVRRELLRSGATISVGALDSFSQLPPNVYLPLTDTALRRASELWAQVRNRGQPTAGDAALDGDVILMAQVLEAAYPRYIVATDNVKHFAGRVLADIWQNIGP